MFGMCFQKTRGVVEIYYKIGVGEIYTKRFHATEFWYNVLVGYCSHQFVDVTGCLPTLSVSERVTEYSNAKRKLFYLNILNEF